MSRSEPIRSMNVYDTPLAVIDLETTGLYEGADRVVEIAIVRYHPANGMEVLLDTLVNPQRPVAGTEIHGITDQDVADAPVFSEISDDVMEALSGCLVASYNVYYDMRFLNQELLRSRTRMNFPHLCLMYLRPLLGVGRRVRLEIACAEQGVEFNGAHTAIGDAIAAAGLYEQYLSVMRECKVQQFGELATRFGKSYKFFDSFALPLPAVTGGTRRYGATTLKRRGAATRKTSPPDAPSLSRPVNPLAAYWEQLVVFLSDLEISDDEMAEIARLRRTLALDAAEIRYVHGRLFSAVLAQYSDDKRLDDRECDKLKKLHHCLAQLGWAPGG